MNKCKECGKEFKTAQGLAGHSYFVHGIKVDKRGSSKRFITDEELLKTFNTVMDAIIENRERIAELYKLNAEHGEVLKKLTERVYSA